MRGGTTGSVTCFESTPTGDGAWNGGVPVSARYSVASKLLTEQGLSATRVPSGLVWPTAWPPWMPPPPSTALQAAG